MALILKRSAVVCQYELQHLDFSDVTTHLSSHGIIVSGSGEGAAELADLSSGFVNGNNISERKQRNPVQILTNRPIRPGCYETVDYIKTSNSVKIH